MSLLRLSAWKQFSWILATAVSLTMTGALAAYALGYANELTSLLLVAMFVSACIAAPVGVIIAQNEYRNGLTPRGAAGAGPTDRLTGLLNRQFFEMAMIDERQRIEQTQRTAAIAIFEIDKISVLRADLGDQFADQVVRQVAVIAYTELRGPFDRLARWSDEAFIILLSDVSVGQALKICERLRQRIEDATVRFRSDRARVTASFGVAPLVSEQEFEDTIAEAEDALHNSRRFGRNQVRSA